MRKVLVATHGRFAEGIKETLQFIMGDSCKVEIISAYVSSDFDMEGEARKRIDELGQDEELIVAADLFGGSVANIFTEYVQTGKVHILTGVNLPMLIVLATSADCECSTEELIHNAQQSAKEGIIYINRVLSESDEAEEEIF